MTYTVLGGTLNPTHSLTHSPFPGKIAHTHNNGTDRLTFTEKHKNDLNVKL